MGQIRLIKTQVYCLTTIPNIRHAWEYGDVRPNMQNRSLKRGQAFTKEHREKIQINQIITNLFRSAQTFLDMFTAACSAESVLKT